jgi:hypothetical protein
MTGALFTPTDPGPRTAGGPRSGAIVTLHDLLAARAGKRSNRSREDDLSIPFANDNTRSGRRAGPLLRLVADGAFE